VGLIKGSLVLTVGQNLTTHLEIYNLTHLEIYNLTHLEIFFLGASGSCFLLTWFCDGVVFDVWQLKRRLIICF
jgi:hypothetical protein